MTVRIRQTYGDTETYEYKPRGFYEREKAGCPYPEGGWKATWHTPRLTEEEWKEIYASRTTE